MSKLKTEFNSPGVSTGFLLWQISNTWQSQQRRALKTFDLTHVQFVLLTSLVWTAGKEPITQRQLATLTKTDVMMTSQVLRTLEKKALITRTSSLADKRAVHIAPTKAGIALANRAVIAVEKIDAQFFGALGNDASRFALMMQALAS